VLISSGGFYFNMKKIDLNIFGKYVSEFENDRFAIQQMVLSLLEIILPQILLEDIRQQEKYRSEFISELKILPIINTQL